MSLESKLQFNGLRPKFGIRNSEFGIIRASLGGARSKTGT